MVPGVTLLRAANLRLTFGSRTVFDGLSLVVEEGERVGLVGVNGAGKSSLMKILAGAMAPDAGELQTRRHAKITYLPQEPEFTPGATVRGELAVAQAALKRAIEEHARLSDELAHAGGEGQGKLLSQLAALGDEVERLGGWDTEHRAKTLLDRLGVRDWERPVAQLSGGERKRVALARTLLEQPELLLLDEPTNHLDADTVDWLEDELDAFRGALLLVTHDRYFLDDLVDRIVEIAPGEGLTSYPGNYAAYLEQKLAEEEANEVREHKRQRWMAQEVAWLRQGVEARRTKSKSRIERAKKLMAQKGFVHPQVAALRAVAAPRLGHTVLEAEHVTKRFGARLLFDDASLLVTKGERLGIVGPNGVGKTTFLRVLLGELPADSGEVVVGKNTRVAYYDQTRQSLDAEATVYDAAWHEDSVDVGGQRLPLREFLDDLLFPPPMQRMQVKALSGGERNRLLLARLFLEGANVLVLDEPTNDLDLVTLNVLEGLLLQFAGCVLLVTHDRYFLDKVATSILAFEGEGRVVRYPGNYETYRTLKAQAEAGATGPAGPARRPVKEPQSAPPKRLAKLSYKEQRELEGIEATLEAAEAKKASLEAQLADPASYAQGSALVPRLNDELAAAAGEVERLYSRWQELQSRASPA